jgi:putative DNA primase/helicase
VNLEVQRGRPRQETPSPESPAATKPLDTSILEQPADIVFDAAHAVYFLDAVFGNINSGRFSISYPNRQGRWRSEHFQWLRFASARAAEWDVDLPQGIYFRTTMLPDDYDKTGRGGADDAHALAFLWADVDYGTVGHKPPPSGLPLPPDEEAARKIITKLPTPSLIINSGGGLYPIWMYKQPIYLTEANRAEAKTRSQRWQNLIAAKAAELGWHYGSGVGDLARVLRLPGSVNRKVPELERPCRVIAVSGQVLPTW